MSIDTGGPAFPHPDYLAQGWEGMTLRDYFAAKAMASFISKGDGFSEQFTSDDDHDDKISRWSYEMADAMMKARTK